MGCMFPAMSMGAILRFVFGACLIALGVFVAREIEKNIASCAAKDAPSSEQTTAGESEPDGVLPCPDGERGV
jgi:hypothetical protein